MVIILLIYLLFYN